MISSRVVDNKQNSNPIVTHDPNRPPANPLVSPSFKRSLMSVVNNHLAIPVRPVAVDDDHHANDAPTAMG